MITANIYFLIKFGILIILSVALIILAIRNTNKGQVIGWETFCKLAKKFRDKKISEEEFNKLIKERR